MYHSSGDEVFGGKWDPPPLTPRALHRLLMRKSHVPEVLQGTLLKLGAFFFLLHSFSCFTGTKVQLLTRRMCG